MDSPELSILVAESDRFSPRAEAILGNLGRLQMSDLDRAGLLREVGHAQVLWVRLRNRIDEELIALAPKLKFIVSATTGLNHIDLDHATRRGIRVLSLRGEVDFLRQVRATAEHTLALTLALLRNIPQASEHVRAGGWNRDLFWGHELQGKTVGIVGYGRLGRMVGDYLSTLGARLLAADPAVGSEQTAPGVDLMPLEKLLPEADVVTLHVNLHQATTGFFGHRQFAGMKTGAWFVNTARGELVDEQALLDAIDNRHLAGAAVDVLDHESSEGMESNPLVRYARSHSNLLITPHIGGCTFESADKTEVFLAEKLCEQLRTDRRTAPPSPPQELPIKVTPSRQWW